MIGAGRSYDHPHHVVVEFVAIPFVHIIIFQFEPVGSYCHLEIVEHVPEYVQIFFAARCFVGIEHSFQHLSVAPAATVAESLAGCTAVAQVLLEPCIHHLCAECVAELAYRFYFLKLPHLCV